MPRLSCTLIRSPASHSTPQVKPNPPLALATEVGFVRLVSWGNLSVAEAYRTFNMGVGMIGIGGTPPPGAFAVGELVAREASGDAVLLG